MKHTILLAAAISFNAVAGETVKADVYCDTTTKVIQALKNDHGEVPILTMRGEANAKYVLMANQKSTSWTFIQLEVVQGKSCVYATGDGIDVYKK